MSEQAEYQEQRVTGKTVHRAGLWAPDVSITESRLYLGTESWFLISALCYCRLVKVNLE